MNKLGAIIEFAAAEATALAPPIRPMSVSGRADLGSSGGGESCVLCRAEIGKHGQPRQPDAHGPDAGGNPAKLGAPTKRVEGPRLTSELIPEDDDPVNDSSLNRLGFGLWLLAALILGATIGAIA